MDPTGRSPNSASRWASNVASTLLRCWRRPWGAISLRQVTEKSEKVGVSGIADTEGRELPPAAVGILLADGPANWAALGLPGNVIAYANTPCFKPLSIRFIRARTRRRF